MADRIVHYPPTEREGVAEALHDTMVADPYRWLEDPDSERTQEWVRAQNAVTDAHLRGLSHRPWFTHQVGETLAAPRAGVPWQRGGQYLNTRNDGTQEQDSVHVAGDLATLVRGGRVLIDPAEFSKDGSVSLRGVSVSPDGRWAAYGVSDAGSDWTQWRVREIATGVDIDDVVEFSKFCRAEWLPDSSGYFYLTFPEAKRASGDDAAALGYAELRLHRLGEEQDSDQVVYRDPDRPRVLPTARVTDDGTWLVLELSDGTDERTRVHARRILSDGKLGPTIRVVDEVRSMFLLVGNVDDVLYLHTDEQAPNGRIVAVDLGAVEATRAVEPTTWRAVVAERDVVLDHAIQAGSGFVGVYLDDAAHRVRTFELSGRPSGEIALDGPVSVVALNGRAGDDELFVGVTTFVTPVRGYHVSLDADTVTPLELVRSPVTAPDVVTERLRATSADGTVVPYFLVHRADLPVEGPRSTLLYGYGGFNVATTPEFKAAWPAWVAAGGVLAVANLRGGGEFGRDWHRAGMRENKQNVFDDFVAVAEDLVARGVTTSQQLALHGRSNGGLLVGAVMTQRPELAAVALPMVGVLDLLRFHRFTIGAAWVPEFGDPDVADDFAVLRAYSPLHQLREGTSYPATLALTGDHDDRVVPAHTYKFMAELQRCQAGEAPVLVRVETATGHGVGKPRTALVTEFADLLAFAAEYTGLVPAVSRAA